MQPGRHAAQLLSQMARQVIRQVIRQIMRQVMRQSILRQAQLARQAELRPSLYVFFWRGMKPATK